MNWWVLRRRLPVSWHIAIACLAILTGIFLAQYTPAGLFGPIVWLVVGLVSVGLVLWRRVIYLVPLLIGAGLVIGLWRGSLQQTDLEGVTKSIGENVLVSGVVREDVDTDSNGQTIIRLDQLNINGRMQAGMIWVSASADNAISRSDHVVLEGKLTPGFGSFAASMYRARIISVERPVPGDIALAFRDWFASAIRTAIPDPQASLGIGYLVGQKRELPLDLVEALQIVGLTHVVVASGYNLTILVRLARRLFERVSKYLSALSASAMIAAFIAVTGMSPSMSRAGLVAGLSLAAWYYGRRFHPIVLLSFAASVTLIINPSYAWGDLGWQLSFAAFGGVMILAPLLQRFFFGDTKPRFIRQILGETIAAIIATGPILVGAFGQFSNVAIIANLLVLPLVPYAMLLTFIAGIGALLMPGFATIIGLPATWLLGYMTNVANYLSTVPWSVTNLQLSPLGVGLCYVVLIIVCAVLWRVTKYNLRDINIIE